jgi:hypothetical protein
MRCGIGVGPVAVSAGTITYYELEQAYRGTAVVSGFPTAKTVEIQNNEVIIFCQDINMNRTASIKILASWVVIHRGSDCSD